ncbi:chromate transporter [Candidatus Roizmanbacteria bacterium]|jgi:hypothetical protein|nr:chromate transporter [Candidatus Roizmanbacteria bacterium]
MKNTKSQPTDLKSVFSQLEGTLSEYLGKKAPSLPDNWKEIIVKFAPWLAIIGVVFGIPAVLALLSFGTAVVPLGTIGGVVAGRPFVGINYIVATVFLVINVILEALAIPGLFSRAKKAWYLMYYASLISVISNIIDFNLPGLVIGNVLSLYLLFQVREYYK